MILIVEHAEFHHPGALPYPELIMDDVGGLIPALRLKCNPGGSRSQKTIRKHETNLGALANDLY